MNKKHITLGVLATGVCVGLYVFKDKLKGKKEEDELDDDLDDDLDDELDEDSDNEEGRSSKVRENPKIEAIRKKAAKIPRLKDEPTRLFQELYNLKDPPMVIWATVRAVFVHKLRREYNETPRNFVARVFSLYNKEGITNKAAIGKAYQIAVANLQDKGLLMPNSQTPTSLGSQWGQTYTREIGQKEINKRLLEFNAMLELAKNS
jgi:hypothetical protein